jgi:hypothetical protein
LINTRIYVYEAKEMAYVKMIVKIHVIQKNEENQTNSRFKIQKEKDKQFNNVDTTKDYMSILNEGQVLSYCMMNR